MTDLKTVLFHGDTLVTAERDGVRYVAMKPVVLSMGLNWASQYKRLQRDPVLSEGVVVMTIPSESGIQETLFLRLDLIPGWLATIHAGRIKKDDVRAKVELYQREAYSVLADHFLGENRSAPRVPVDEISEKVPMTVALSMVREARQLFGHAAARELWFELQLKQTPSMFTFYDPETLFQWAGRTQTRRLS